MTFRLIYLSRSIKNTSRSGFAGMEIFRKTTMRRRFYYHSARSDEPVVYVTGGNVSYHGTDIDPLTDLTQVFGCMTGRKIKPYVLPANCLT